MKNCSNCNNEVSNPNHDLCWDCWDIMKLKESSDKPQDSFEENLIGKIYTTYIMFYVKDGKSKEKIGYTDNLSARTMEIKREFPSNKLVYFREFTKETEARLFEAWLKKRTNREIIKFVSMFQDKAKKVDYV